MLKIHQELRTGTFPNATDLAKKLEVSTKSVHRDLDFMRERLLLPIEYEESSFGYYYSEKVDAFPTFQITQGELLALVVAEKALQQYRGTSFEKPLLSAIKKMEQAFPKTISLNLSEIDQTISFRTRAEPILNLEIFDALAKATAGCDQLEIGYRKPGQQQTQKRIIDPYHLANINGEWFLFALDHLRNDLRTFVPARIKGIKRTGKKFVRPRKFSLEQRLRDSFGVHSGQGQHDVLLHFDRAVADYIREKKWHDSQHLKELKNGSVELRLKLSGLEEVERWVLSWGGNARVLKPASLAQAVKQAARKILAR